MAMLEGGSAFAGSDATPILNGVHTPAAASGDQQDVARNADIFVPGGRRAQLNHHRLRDRVEHHVTRQRLTDRPFPGLARRHAAIVLFGQAWRAATGLVLLAVILADDYALLIAKIGAHPDVLRRRLGLLAIVLTRVLSAPVAPLKAALPQRGGRRRFGPRRVDSLRIGACGDQQCRSCHRGSDTDQAAADGGAL